jgi:hypothetical protein
MQIPNVRKDTANALSVARKLWLMPRAELGKLRQESPRAVSQRINLCLRCSSSRSRMGLFMSSAWD